MWLKSRSVQHARSTLKIWPNSSFYLNTRAISDSAGRTLEPERPQQVAAYPLSLLKNRWLSKLHVMPSSCDSSSKINTLVFWVGCLVQFHPTRSENAFTLLPSVSPESLRRPPSSRYHC